MLRASDESRTAVYLNQGIGNTPGLSAWALYASTVQSDVIPHLENPNPVTVIVATNDAWFDWSTAEGADHEDPNSMLTKEFNAKLQRQYPYSCELTGDDFTEGDQSWTGISILRTLPSGRLSSSKRQRNHQLATGIFQWHSPRSRRTKRRRALTPCQLHRSTNATCIKSKWQVAEVACLSTVTATRNGMKKMRRSKTAR